MVRNITGRAKIIFNLRLKISIFFYFLPAFFKGEMSFRRFILLLKRLLFFLSKMQHNKFVEIDGRTRLGLYVPGFPSPAFQTACNKFTRFEEKLPCTTVLISLTSACPYHCRHCYQKLDQGKDVDIDILAGTVKKLQDMGIAFINIEGGEPFIVYDRLKSICSVIDDRSEIWVNSTGAGMTPEKLNELKAMNVTAVMFSLHSPDVDTFNSFLGKDNAWETMKAGVKMCHDAGLAVAFNTCLMRDDFYNGNFEKIMDTAKDLKACLVQLIKPKPAGGWLEREDLELTLDDAEFIKAKVHKYNLEKTYAHYPAISAQIIEEDKNVFGCTAGGTDRFYINAKGDVQPCEFLNISFGNISTDDFADIYQKMRIIFDKGKDCFLCEKYAAKIHRLYREYNLKSLPLSPELSE
ncbi:MAG: radical SAM protein, partial [Desulfitobacteriaceae bacterium]|nr:radical SAM protein [Desulfitobacteriaceae bacterium]